MFKFIKFIFISLIILFSISFGIFIYDFNHFNTTNYKAQALVVLTGANNRIAKALDIYYHNPSTYLFIAGANKQTSLKDIVRLYNIGDKDIDNIMIEQNSTNTLTNAQEITILLKKYNIDNILLITHDYHMRRSILAFKKYNQHLVITPYAIKSANIFNMIIIREFFKLIPKYLNYLG